DSKAGSGSSGADSEGDEVPVEPKEQPAPDMATKFYNLTAKLLTGETLSFSSLQGKVVLIENVASL
ncbi:hypothetical protein INR49_022813, partial [Caranx melampygus]